MLKFFRKSSKSWAARIFFAVFASAILVLFVAGDGLKMGMGGGSDQVLIKVGSEKISAHRFVVDLDKESRLIKLNSGRAPDIEALKHNLLSRLVQNTLLDLEAEKVGLTTSDEEIKFMIKNDRNFKDKSGEFSKAIFDSYLNMLQLNEAQFIHTKKRELAREKLSQTVALASFAPDTIVKPLFEWQYEKRVIDIINVDYSKFNVAKDIAEKDLIDNYDKNPSEYTTPEKRDVTMILISRDQLARDITLTSAEKAAGFAEKSDLSSGKVPTEAESSKIIDEIKADKAMVLFDKTFQKLEDDLGGGAKLADAAKDNNLPLVHVVGLDKNGNCDKADPEIEKYMPQIAQEAFGLQLNDDAPIKELDNRTFVAIKVNKIAAKTLRPLSQVKEDVKKAVTLHKQLLQAKELAEKITTDINSGIVISKAIKGLPVTLKAPITISKTEKDQDIPEQILTAGLMAEKNKAKIAPTPTGFAVVIATKIIPVDEKTTQENYGEFKQVVRSSLANDMVQQYLIALENKYTVDVNKGLLKSISLKN